MFLYQTETFALLTQRRKRPCYAFHIRNWPAQRVSAYLDQDQGRLRKYLERVPLAIAAITGPAGSGKTTLLVIVMLVLLIRFGPGYGSAPTNVACDNLAERLDAIDEQAARAVGYEEEDIYSAPPDASTGPQSSDVDAASDPDCAPVVDLPLVPALVDSAPNKIGKERHFVLRGYSLHTEVEAVLELLKGSPVGDGAIKLGIWRPSTAWHFKLSAAFYLCLCLGLPGAGRQLTPEDSHRLHALANTFRHDKNLEGTRLLAAGTITHSEYVRRTDALTDKSILGRLLKVIKAADIVVTTPALAYSGPELTRPEDVGKKGDKKVEEAEGLSPYGELKNKAAWFGIDEAGAMSRADALTVLGNTGKPCVLGGDHKQLPPFVASPMGVNAAGDAMNRHAADTGISILGWHMFAGMPVFRLRVQRRMAKGQSDLSGDLVYEDLEWEYGPGSDISLSQHEPGRLLEEFARSRYPDLRASKPDELLPLFLHVPGGAVKDPRSGSRCNPVQNRQALAFILDLVEEKGIDPAHIAVITPYTWNAQVFNAKAKSFGESLARLPAAATVDSWQGRENEIVIYIMVVNKSSGPGFVADKQRSNVAWTRQRCGLVIVGDVNVVGNAATEFKARSKAKGKGKSKSSSIEVMGSSGETIRVNPGVLKELCVRLFGLGRVVTPARLPAVKPVEAAPEDKLAEEVEAEEKVEEDDKGKGKGKE